MSEVRFTIKISYESDDIKEAIEEIFRKFEQADPVILVKAFANYLEKHREEFNSEVEYVQ